MPDAAPFFVTTSSMKIAVFSAQPYDQRFLDEALAQSALANTAQWAYFAVGLSPDTAPLARGCDAVCVFVNDQLNAITLEALHGLGVRAVVLRCAGFNQLDSAAAQRLKLFVARVPAYSPEAVAEHTLALVMTLNRHIHRAYNRVREGNFALDGLMGRNLHGKTVGLVGVGSIGVAAARIFNGLGCTVLGADPSPSPAFETLGETVPLNALLERADIVSLHCPLTADTRHLIDAAALARMQPGAMLVNTARGALVDTAAVVQALQSRQLGSLALDVYEEESALFFHDHSGEIIDDELFQRLTTFPNVLITGHQGFFTQEALHEIAAITVHNLQCFANGIPCANILPAAAGPT